MTGGHSRLGANDRGSFSRGVTQDYDTGTQRRIDWTSTAPTSGLRTSHDLQDSARAGCKINGPDPVLQRRRRRWKNSLPQHGGEGFRGAAAKWESRETVSLGSGKSTGSGVWSNPRWVGETRHVHGMSAASSRPVADTCKCSVTLQKYAEPASLIDGSTVVYPLDAPPAARTGLTSVMRRRALSSPGHPQPSQCHCLGARCP